MPAGEDVKTISKSEAQDNSTELDEAQLDAVRGGVIPVYVPSLGQYVDLNKNPFALSWRSWSSSSLYTRVNW